MRQLTRNPETLAGNCATADLPYKLPNSQDMATKCYKEKEERISYAWVISGSCETHMTACLQNEAAWQSATPQKAIVKPLTLRRLILPPPLGLTPLTWRLGNKVGLCLCLGVDILNSWC